MKTSSKSVLAALVLAIVAATAVNAGSSPRMGETVRAVDATWTPASVDFPADDSITVPEMVITARRMTRAASKAPKAGDCSFGFRSVVQGPVGASVRGFCK